MVLLFHLIVMNPYTWMSDFIWLFQYESEEQEQNMTDMKLKNEKERIDFGKSLSVKDKLPWNKFRTTNSAVA